MIILGIFAILILGIWDIFQNNQRDMGYWDPHQPPFQGLSNIAQDIHASSS